MPTNRLKRIQLIVDLARQAERQAGGQLKHTQENLHKEQQRLKEVQEYYHSYSALFEGRTRSLTASDLSRSREFLANLDRASSAQQAQVLKAEQSVAAARQQWQASYQKLQAVLSYQERCEKQEQLRQDRFEQKLLDELSAQSPRSRILSV